jgi:hypothetical protein
MKLGVTLGCLFVVNVQLRDRSNLNHVFATLKSGAFAAHFDGHVKPRIAKRKRVSAPRTRARACICSSFTNFK